MGGTTRATALVWDVSTHRCPHVHTISAPDDLVTAVAFSAHMQHTWLGMGSGGVMVDQFVVQDSVGGTPGHMASVSCATFAYGVNKAGVLSNSLITCGGDSSVRSWSGAWTQKGVWSTVRKATSVDMGPKAPTGAYGAFTRFLVAGAGSTVQVWGMGRRVTELHLVGGAGRRRGGGGGGGGQQDAQTQPRPRSRVEQVLISPDGGWLVVRYASGTVRVWANLCHYGAPARDTAAAAGRSGGADTPAARAAAARAAALGVTAVAPWVLAQTITDAGATCMAFCGGGCGLPPGAAGVAGKKVATQILPTPATSSGIPASLKAVRASMRRVGPGGLLIATTGGVTEYALVLESGSVGGGEGAGEGDAPPRWVWADRGRLPDPHNHCPDRRVVCMAVDLAGDTVAAAFPRRQCVYIWHRDPGTGGWLPPTASLRPQGENVTALAFTPDGGLLAVGVWAGSVVMYAPRAPDGGAQHESIQRFRSFGAVVTALTVSRCGAFLVAATLSGAVKVWVHRDVLKPHGPGVCGVRVRPGLQSRETAWRLFSTHQLLSKRHSRPFRCHGALWAGATGLTAVQLALMQGQQPREALTHGDGPGGED